MRHAFAHDAVLLMEPTGDIAAPGAAVTVALCGQVEHDPPCPLAAHHTGAQRDGEEVRLRILFAAEASEEAEVRRRIQQALAEGEPDGPGAGPGWRLRDSGPSPVTADEADHAERLTRS